MFENHLNQAEFARLLDVTEGFVTKVIQLKSKFSIIKGKRAAIVLRCHIDDLYEWEY
jgi:hypothetical protein